MFPSFTDYSPFEKHRATMSYHKPQDLAINTRTLDHIVYLTPPGTLEDAVRDFRAIGFQCVIDPSTSFREVSVDSSTWLDEISGSFPVGFTRMA